MVSPMNGISFFGVLKYFQLLSTQRGISTKKRFHCFWWMDGCPFCPVKKCSAQHRYGNFHWEKRGFTLLCFGYLLGLDVEVPSSCQLLPFPTPPVASTLFPIIRRIPSLPHILLLLFFSSCSSSRLSQLPIGHSPLTLLLDFKQLSIFFYALFLFPFFIHRQMDFSLPLFLIFSFSPLTSSFFTSILHFFYFSPFGQPISPFPIFQLLSLSNTLLFYILSTMMISSSPIIGEHLSSSIGGSSRRNGPASAGSTFTSSSPLGGPLANNPNGRIPSSPRSPQQQQRHSSVSSSRHTIHPKLSLSAKRSTASMTAGGAAQQQQQNGHGASTSSFQLTISFSNAETGAPITFKQDGSRFQTSQRTMKLQSNCKYKVNLKTQPPQDFLSLHIGGSDLELVNNADGQAPGGGTGQYMAMWNTTGIDPSKKGLRQDILFVLAGPGKTLSRKLQTKFYRRQDSHAGMGHRLDALIWSCEADPIGQVAVTDEKLL